MVVFSNECYHRLVSIEYPQKDNNDSDNKQLERTILAYFLISPNEVNVDKIWINDLVNILLCGDFDYIYHQRDQMRLEKGKGVKGPPKRRRPNFGCLEGGTPR